MTPLGGTSVGLYAALDSAMLSVPQRPRATAPGHVHAPLAAPQHHEKLICAAAHNRAMLLGMVSD